MGVRSAAILGTRLACLGSQSQELIGIPWDGQIVRIDAATVSTSSLGSVSGLGSKSFSRGPQARLVAVNHASAAYPRLRRVGGGA
jgi:hypothetical protein